MNKRDFAVSTGVEIRTLEIWLERHWLVLADAKDGAQFTDADAARARLIVELKDEFGANDEGVDIILHLIDQLHGVRGALARLRDELDRRGAA